MDAFPDFFIHNEIEKVLLTGIELLFIVIPSLDDELVCFKDAVPNLYTDVSIIPVVVPCNIAVKPAPPFPLLAIVVPV